MDYNAIENIKNSFLSFFDKSYEQEIEKLFDEIIIILWEFNEDQVKIVYENQKTNYSEDLKQYWINNWKNYYIEGLAGFCLPNAKNPTIFIETKNYNKLIAQTIHEVLHLFLNKKLNRMETLKHDFLVEIIIEHVTSDILLIYNSLTNDKNEQYSTYLALDEIVDFPIKRLYLQLIDEIKKNIESVNEFVDVIDKASISVYFQDLLDKVYVCDREKSFRAQYPECIAEYSVEIKNVVDSILQKYIAYKNEKSHLNK